MAKVTGLGHRVDPDHPVPIYHQLKSLLLESVASGDLLPGERLPTEAELCARFGISRTPVSRALSELAEDGIVIRRRRLGTFVNPDLEPGATPGTSLSVLVPRSLGSELAASVGSRAIVEQVDDEDISARLIETVIGGDAPDVAVVDAARAADLSVAGFLAPGVNPVGVRSHRTGVWIRRSGVQLGRLPETWGELSEAARGARDDDPAVISPLVTPLLGVPERATELVATLLAANGAALMQRGRVGVASAEAVEALVFLRSLVDEGLMASDVTGFDENEAVSWLCSGRALACLGNDAMRPALAARLHIANHAVDGRFAFIAFPAGPRGSAASLVAGWVAVVTAQSRRPRLADALMRSLTSEAPADDELWWYGIGGLAAGHGGVVAASAVLVDSILSGRLRPAAAAVQAADFIVAATGLQRM